jgi:2-amino-4-hydroxy-6-hydroxymethyldihydropteridine diphosphokinase
MQQNCYIVTIGSNDNAEANVKAVKRLLQQQFTNILFAPFCWTQPTGNHYNLPFYNGAVRFSSSLLQSELKMQLKEMEAQLGRTTDMKALGIVPIDLDIITCNNQIVHPDYNRFPFVKKAVDSLLIVKDK